MCTCPCDNYNLSINRAKSLGQRDYFDDWNYFSQKTKRDCEVKQYCNQTKPIKTYHSMMSNGLNRIDHRIPTAEQTMRHKRFNKIAPFHTHTSTRKGQFQSCNSSNYPTSIITNQFYCQ